MQNLIGAADNIGMTFSRAAPMHGGGASESAVRATFLVAQVLGALSFYPDSGNQQALRQAHQIASEFFGRFVSACMVDLPATAPPEIVDDLYAAAAGIVRAHVEATTSLAAFSEMLGEGIVAVKSGHAGRVSKFRGLISSARRSNLPEALERVCFRLAVSLCGQVAFGNGIFDVGRETILDVGLRVAIENGNDILGHFTMKLGMPDRRAENCVVEMFTAIVTGIGIRHQRVEQSGDASLWPGAQEILSACRETVRSYQMLLDESNSSSNPQGTPSTPQKSASPPSPASGWSTAQRHPNHSARRQEPEEDKSRWQNTYARGAGGISAPAERAPGQANGGWPSNPGSSPASEPGKHEPQNQSQAPAQNEPRSQGTKRFGSFGGYQ